MLRNKSNHVSRAIITRVFGDLLPTFIDPHGGDIIKPVASGRGIKIVHFHKNQLELVGMFAAILFEGQPDLRAKTSPIGSKIEDHSPTCIQNLGYKVIMRRYFEM